MNDSSPMPPAHPRPAPLRTSRRRVVRLGVTGVLTAALVWPTATAPALAAPVLPAAVAAAADDPSAQVLAGRVTDDSGAPLEGVDVQVHGTTLRDTTDADGAWRIEGPADGPVALGFVVAAPGGNPSTLYWDGTPYGSYVFAVVPGLEEDQSRSDLDLVVADNAVTGTVTADGVPVAGATVGFHRWTTDAPVATATTAADGTYTARYLRPGYYTVQVTPPAGSGLAPTWWNRVGDSYGSVGFVEGRPYTYTNLDVTLSAESRLTGRVVDEAGQPVAGVDLALWGPARVRPGVVSRTTSAADGTYDFTGVAPGEYTVQVVGATPADDTVVHDFVGGSLTAAGASWTRVGAQEVVAAGDVVRRRGGTISGDVVGSDGWNGPGLVVEFVAADGSVVASLLATDDPAGPDFATPGAVPAGQYRIRATIAGDAYWWVGGNSAATARVLDVVPGAALTDVALVLAEEYLEEPEAPTEPLTEDNRGGLSVVAPVAPGGTAAIAGLSDGASFVWLAPAMQALGYGLPAADGTLQVTVPGDVAPGSYRLAVTTRGGYLVGWADLTVAAAAGDPTAGAAPVPSAPGAVAPAPVASRGAAATTGALATTGSDAAWLAGSALTALVLGVGFVLVRRRRAA